jgi:predicted RNA-binding Zn ribbon-like protein
MKLSLVVSAVSLASGLAVFGARLIGDSSHGTSEPGAPQQAFQSWQDSALPVILGYRQALAAAQTPSRVAKPATRVRSAERARSTLMRLAATLRAAPPIATHELRRLNTTLAQAIGLAIAGERTYALALRDHRSDLMRRAKLQLDHSAAVMFYMSLRANAIGTELNTTQAEG